MYHLFSSPETDPDVYTLQSANGLEQVTLNLHKGMTVELWSSNGISLIHFDSVRKAAGSLYGVPILYPTPNRVANNGFSFENQTYSAAMHGMLKDYTFSSPTFNMYTDRATCSAKAYFTPGTQAYALFPFISIFTVSITLSKGCIRWDICIENNDTKPLPYGLGLHPYFTKFDDTSITADVTTVMEMNEAKLPTGLSHCPSSVGFSAQTPHLVHQTILDHVFTLQETPEIQITYPNYSSILRLQGDAQMKKLVVYTPQGKDWFCLENQTSSTDCHNLANNGYPEAANLQIIKPGQIQSHHIIFSFESVQGKS